jgi:hypothetical protein
MLVVNFGNEDFETFGLVLPVKLVLSKPVKSVVWLTRAHDIPVLLINVPIALCRATDHIKSQMDRLYSLGQGNIDKLLQTGDSVRSLMIYPGLSNLTQGRACC